MAKTTFWDKFKRAMVGGPNDESNRTSYPSSTQKPNKTGLPTKRSSIPHQPFGTQILEGLSSQYRVVNHDFIVQVIPIIRKLMKVNPDVGQAIHNIITLGNTGHKVYFDRTISPDQVDKMRNHLENKKKEWAAGQAGMDGLVNKFFAQLLVGGAISNEWVPNKDLSGIDSVILVNPEDIIFVLEKGNLKYSPYQRIINGISPVVTSGPLEPIKLNERTFKYYALNGDTEIPYGFPPYMNALERIKTQGNMEKNIDFVIDQMGLLGFLQLLIQKPDPADGEDEQNYTARLDALLDEAKVRLESGLKDGSVVGWKDDNEMDFKSFNKSLTDSIELYKNNELQLASGLKQDASLWGRNYGTTESQITVVFIKMLSELRNIQNIVKCNLEFGYGLELMLAGFKFDYLKVVFNRSTLQDDLKFNQAEEIRVRNVKEKMIMGLVNQDQAADELGYEAPAFPKPMVSWDVLAGGTDPAAQAAAKTTRKVQKGKSAKKTRQKNKPIAK